MTAHKSADFDAVVRSHVYRVFVGDGRAPSVEDLAAALDASADDVAAALQRLQQNHALVLAPGTPNVWMAHPFSAVPTPYRVRFDGRRYWANCAWDYLAMPSLLSATGVQRARCAQTGSVVEASFDRGVFVAGDGVVHFAIPPRRFWENVAYT
jgi:hypothetical protein